MNISQVEFQKLVGKIEVLGELLLKNAWYIVISNKIKQILVFLFWIIYTS
jgi:hypothetical protein